MINDVVVEIRNLLATAMTTRCAAYYAGNIGLPANVQMPVCIVKRKAESLDNRRSTTTDYYKYTISVLIITNIVKSLGTAGLTDGLVASENTLGNIIGERDTDGAPKLDTVLGVLSRQQNLRGTNYIYLNNIAVNYEPELNGVDLFVGAEVTFDAYDTFTRKA